MLSNIPLLSSTCLFSNVSLLYFFFFFQAEDGIRDLTVTGVQTCALPILGLGVNAAIFSLTREVLLRPLPYRDADRLVRVFEVSRTLGVASAPIAPVNYIAWRDLVDAFEQTATFRRVAFNEIGRAACRERG